MADTTEKPDGRKNCTTGKLGDPEFRHQRAVRANETRNSTANLVQRIVARAPELTIADRTRLAMMLLVTPPHE